MATNKYNYFEALTKMIDYSCQAAEYLDNVINNFDVAALPKNIEEIHRMESDADHKRHEIMERLAKEFLPPIEREDLIDLVNKLDDIADSVEETMQFFYIYNVENLIPECKEFSRLVIRCCDRVKKLTEEFPKFQKSNDLQRLIIEIHDLEGNGDQLFFATMRRIFTSPMSDKDVLVWSHIVTSFEACYDRCEEVSEIFESAIMKNS